MFIENLCAREVCLMNKGFEQEESVLQILHEYNLWLSAE